MVAVSLAAVTYTVLLLTTVTEEDVRSWIATDLSIGSEKLEVIAFCERKGMEHSGNYEPELHYEKSHQISASIQKNHAYLNWFDGGVYVVFFFDANDRLTHYDVHEAFTFL